MCCHLIQNIDYYHDSDFFPLFDFVWLLSTVPFNFYKMHHRIFMEHFTNAVQALLFVAAEDEAFIDYNGILDARSLLDERNGVESTFDTYSDCDVLEVFPLAGKTISQWLHELNVIAKEVEAELVYRDIGCDLMVVLEAVNAVLFDFRSFKRFPVLVDSKFSYKI